MKQILKEHSYDIVKLVLYHVVTSIFAIILDIPVVAEISDKSFQTKILAVVSFLAIILFYYLIYTSAWEWGAKDRIRVDAGRREKTAYKGALLGGIANSLGILMALVLLFTLANPTNFSGVVFNVVYYILYLFSYMYYGIVEFCFSGINDLLLAYRLRCVGYLVLPLLAVLVIHIAYTLGYKEKKLFRFSKNKKPKA